MIKVKATGNSALNQMAIKELGRIAVEGEEFYVTDERYDVLIGNNPYNLVLVVASDPRPITIPTPAPVTTTPVGGDKPAAKAKPVKKTAKGKKDSAKVNTGETLVVRTEPIQVKQPVQTQLVKPVVNTQPIPVPAPNGRSLDEFSNLKFDYVGDSFNTGAPIPNLDTDPYSIDYGVDDTFPTPTSAPKRTVNVSKSRTLKG